MGETGVALVETADSAVLHRFEAADGVCAAFAVDGLRAWVGTGDGSVHVLDMETGAACPTLESDDKVQSQRRDDWCQSGYRILESS